MAQAFNLNLTNTVIYFLMFFCRPIGLSEDKTTKDREYLQENKNLQATFIRSPMEHSQKVKYGINFHYWKATV